MMTGYAALEPLTSASSAISSEARAVRRAAFEVVHHAELSQSLFGAKATAISELWRMANECGKEDWDGNDALDLNARAVANSVAFIRALPDGLPLPEIAPEPDGSVSLDWISARHRMFSISVSSSDRLAFAWIDGSDKGHGVARFDGRKVPARVIQGIQSIATHGDTSFRAA